MDEAAVGAEIVRTIPALSGRRRRDRSHYVAAAAALAAANPHRLARLITRRVPLDRWREAFERRSHDVKGLIEFGAA